MNTHSCQAYISKLAGSWVVRRLLFFKFFQVSAIYFYGTVVKEVEFGIGSRAVYFCK